MKPCIFIYEYPKENTLHTFLQNMLLHDQTKHIPIIVAHTPKPSEKNKNDVPFKATQEHIQHIYLEKESSFKKLLRFVQKKTEHMDYSHIICVNAKKIQTLDNILFLLKNASEHPKDILLYEEHTPPKKTFVERITTKIASFCVRVNTAERIKNPLQIQAIYPLAALQCIKSTAKGQDFALALHTRALWAGFAIQEISLLPEKTTETLASTPTTKRIKKHAQNFARILMTAIHLTMRALIPLPFKRYDSSSQNAISLRHPIKALRSLMHDPHNRATPRELARTAGISMAILTLPAPIVQSVFLLLCIGWLRMNRLCAIAMIPLTWPPFLPGLAILVGYRLRHGTWLSEFSIQTLGYEVGERIWEWVLGSLFLTPILGLLLAILVGSLAFSVDLFDTRKS